MAALFACTCAQAPRPMVVDDASITGPGNCQVESWTQRIPVPGRLAVDAGLGSRMGRPGAERYVTVGLTLAGPVFRRAAAPRYPSARAAGSETVSSAPRTGPLAAAIRPPYARTIACDSASPRPTPATVPARAPAPR